MDDETSSFMGAVRHYAAGMECERSKNPNPVTLVGTVLARKSAVQPSSHCEAISPHMTSNHDQIPTKLNITCTRVNVVVPKLPIRVSLEPL